MVMKNNLAKALGVGCLTAALATVAITGMRSAGTVKKGDKAPAWSASGTDGKTHTLASLTKSGPVYLYFIKEGCPVNHRAAPFVTKIYNGYSSKGTLIGVYDGSVADAKKWQATYGAKYTLIADPELAIIKSYGIPYSPFMVEVGKDGKVTNVLEGLSPKELGAFNTSYSKTVKANTIAMDYKGAPSGGG